MKRYYLPAKPLSVCNEDMIVSFSRWTADSVQYGRTSNNGHLYTMARDFRPGHQQPSTFIVLEVSPKRDLALRFRARNPNELSETVQIVCRTACIASVLMICD